MHASEAFFVTRAKSNIKAKRRHSHRLDRATGLICDQTITLTVYYSKSGYPETLRRIRHQAQDGKTVVLLTNNFSLPAITVTELHRCHWQVAFFF